MKHLKKFEDTKPSIINESKSTIDPVVSMEVETVEWDDPEDFGKTKTLIVKTKSGKIYKTKLKSDEDEDYSGEQ